MISDRKKPGTTMKALERAISIFQRESWRGDVLHWRFHAGNLKNLGTCHAHLGNAQAAQNRLGQALRLFGEFLDSGHADITYVRNRLVALEAST